MTPEEARELAEWGERVREFMTWRTEADTPAGAARAAWIEGLSPSEGAVALRAMLAETETQGLTGKIVRDLRVAPEKAELIAEEIAASRRRLERVTRPYHLQRTR